FEAHRFNFYTGGKYKDNFTYDQSEPWTRQAFRKDGSSSWANFHKDQGMEWEMLDWAMSKDRDAALKSTSMGLGQIMGENYKQAGFKSPEEMFNKFRLSDEYQLRGMLNFVYNSPVLAGAVKAGSFPNFAAGYNGPGQVPKYVQMMMENYMRFKAPAK
ncbi:MAG: DUF3380 domain-containing protein, partial [Spirochaetia bacterium]|nr:DUF3380 domain-containing protein [Spirochaetia bacterium]